MAITSRRGKILTGLMKQLDTITTGNGYSISVNKVTMDVKNWTDTPAAETPVIYVVDDSTQPKYHAGKLIEWEWTVALFVVMRDRSQMEMEEHISDILECLYENVTLAYTTDDDEPVLVRPISQLRVRNIVTDNQLFSEQEGSQLFKITLELLYPACVGQR